MASRQRNNLIPTILIIGLVIALLSYLSHPDVGQFSLMINGEPVAGPLVRLAVIPTVLLVLFIIGSLSVVVFLGVGIVLFWAALFFALLGIALIAPFFWPILAIIFLLFVLMTSGNGNKD